MDDLYACIEKTKEYYAQVEKECSAARRRIFQTSSAKSKKREKGVFLANSIDVFVDIIAGGIMGQRNTLKLEEINGLKLFGAGCGDSRELAIGSLFLLDCYGADLDKKLIEISKNASSALKEQKVIPKRFKVTEGSFNDDSTYAKLKVRFDQIDYFLHSINSESVFPLITKFSEQAKAGANMILLGGPGVVEMINPEEYGLRMSRLYQAQCKRSLQQSYVFLEKPV